MQKQAELKNQAPLDYGGEVLYAFECLPLNAAKNAEITQRAAARTRAAARLSLR